MSDTESREPRSPALLAGRAPSRETAGQIGRYLIGAIVALVLDATLVSLLLSAGLPIFGARTLGLMAGMTTTYFFNRRYTFDVTHGASLHDWSRYLAAQSLGSALNFAVSARCSISAAAFGGRYGPPSALARPSASASISSSPAACCIGGGNTRPDQRAKH